MYYIRRNVLFQNGIADVIKTQLSEPRCAATHDLALADKLGVELGSVEREVDVEVYAVEGALWGVHALEVFFEVLPREVRGKCDDFLDAW